VVLELDEAAQPLGAPHAHDPPVLHRDHGRAAVRGDLQARASPTGRRPPSARAAAARVRRATGVDREAPLREAAERADEVGGQRPDRARARQHRAHVPVRVVVGEHGRLEVALRVRRAQVPGGAEDRVDRVVGIALAIAVPVGAVRAPRRGQELHPADGTRRAHVEVAAVVSLDLVDRREHLPAHAVLHTGGLVDRQEEERDPESVDGAVRDAEGGAGVRQAGREGGRGRRRDGRGGRRRGRGRRRPRRRGGRLGAAAGLVAWGRIALGHDRRLRCRRRGRRGLGRRRRRGLRGRGRRGLRSRRRRGLRGRHGQGRGPEILDQRHGLGDADERDLVEGRVGRHLGGEEDLLPALEGQPQRAQLRGRGRRRSEGEKRRGDEHADEIP
jgi:hypothetical protein